MLSSYYIYQKNLKSIVDNRTKELSKTRNTKKIDDIYRRYGRDIKELEERYGVKNTLAQVLEEREASQKTEDKQAAKSTGKSAYNPMGFFERKPEKREQGNSRSR